MSDSAPSTWQELYERVLTETDEDRLVALLTDTDGAIFSRRQELADSMGTV
jgi:hypothetical protein